ncbi:MAG: hypothetical protein M1360_01130 [Candidatus Marsarchaeota archaeon]|jgi:3-hydroxy-3-methylglutaryl CoA synthase|nr:hypothetical protein [Candidatus Marsarchaeota archaeon]MCL5418525.1 hypothetical protein [Candidatus Marsarchaeota archaeon]
MAKKNVGISEIAVATPHLSISAAELAKALTAKGVIEKLYAMVKEDSNALGEKIREMEDLIELSYPYGPVEEYIAGKFGSNYLGHAYSFNELRDEKANMDIILASLESTNSLDGALAVVKPLMEKGVISNQEIDEILSKSYVDPKKIEEGLGNKNIVLPSFAEGNVTFVADNLYKFIKGIVSDKKKFSSLMDKPIRTIYYSSESNPDRSRPELEIALELVSSKLIEEDEQKYRPVISMLRHAMLYPTTYACVGGVMSLDQAARGLGDGESALVISSDIAIYDPELAPNAELTQGAGSVLMWITHDPEIAAIHYSLRSAYHMALSDFTKYFKEYPVVHGKFSEIVYVYNVAKALESSKIAHVYKLENGMSISEKVLDFFVNHVPFSKQAIYFASFLFVHEMRNFNRAVFEEMQKRPDVGPEPLSGFSSLTDLLDHKFKQFNVNGDKEEQDIIKYIEEDPDIKRYWAWLSGIRKQPEFKEFIRKLKIDKALVLPSQTGNVYSSASLQSFTSLLDQLSKCEDAELGLSDSNKVIHLEGILGGFGSGAQGVVEPITISTTKEKLINNISISMDTVTINAEQYIELHRWLTGNTEAIRASESGNLFEKTKAFLRSEMPDGFYTIKRNIDGTGEYAYVQNGSMSKIHIRY